MAQELTADIDQDGILKHKSVTWKDVSIHSYIKIIVIAALFFFLFRHELQSLVRTWYTDKDWSHGFIIPLFSLYLINQRSGAILSEKPKPSIIGLLALVFLLFLYPFNIVQLQYGYLRPLTMLAVLGAIVLFMTGWRIIKYAFVPVAFLFFAIPIPNRYYVRISMPLRTIGAAAAGAILDLMEGVEATVQGVIIDVIHHGQPLETPLNVAEACSGMRLLMAFVALGVAMAYLHYRPIWQRLVLLASTVPIAIFCNIVRVTITGFIYVYSEPKYAQGIYHDGLGLAMLFLAFGLYGILAWFMGNLFVDETQQKTEPEVIVANKKNPE